MSIEGFQLPRMVRWLIKRLADEELLASVTEDFESRCRSAADRLGPLRARLWCGIHILSLLSSFAVESLVWRWGLIRSYIKLAFRQILRQRVYSTINIVGLAVGIACFFLIGLWVRDELSFDRFHEKKDRIFRILNKMEDGDLIPSPTYALAPALKALHPEVVEYSRVIPWYSSLVRHGDKVFQEFGIHLADPGFFRMFTFPFIRGNPDTALEDRHAIVLTERAARKYFGNGDPIGEVLFLDHENADFTVTGVILDVPPNSHLQFDIITRVELLGEDRLARWEEWVGPCYIMLRPGTSAPDFETKIAGIYREYVDPEARFSPVLQPLVKVHLYENGQPGDVKKVYAFSAIALFILLMACINFMNLATARSARRAQEVGMRKVIGAYRPQIVRQFLGEALAVSFIALILAVILVEVALPWFNRFTAKSLTLLSGASLGMILGLVSVAAFTGFVAGSYPAFFLSSFQPVDTLRRHAGRGSRAAALRKMLIVFQFAVSVGLITCTLVVSSQLRFIQTMDLGLDREHVLGLVNNPVLNQRFDDFKSALEGKPGVLHVTAGAQPPTEVGQSISIDWEGNPHPDMLNVDYSVVDYDFFETFEMRIVQGRSFSRRFPTDEKQACIINRTAADRMGVEDPIGMVIYMAHPAWPEEFRRARIIGVVKDFHARSVHTAIRPFVFRMYRPWHVYGFIKVDGNRTAEAIEHVEESFRTHAQDYPFQYMFYDELFNRQYVKERQLGRLFNGFSLLSVLIACLGLFGLASYSTEQKTKEIGIRKVLGASVPKILTLTAREFVKWVAVANLVGWPVAYFLMYRWLGEFAYRVRLGPAVFGLAAGLALLIALLTVAFHSLKAALSNPVESLRYE